MILHASQTNTVIFESILNKTLRNDLGCFSCGLFVCKQFKNIKFSSGEF